MAEVTTTYVVECFLPGVDDASVQQAADATAIEVRRLGLADREIEYVGALLMAGDEVVLHTFRARDPELVRRVSAAAGLAFARIVESVAVSAAPGAPLPGRPPGRTR